MPMNGRLSLQWQFFSILNKERRENTMNEQCLVNKQGRTDKS